MHPVDFIVFDGMNEKDMKNVTLLSRKPSDKVQSKVLASIGKATVKNSPNQIQRQTFNRTLKHLESSKKLYSTDEKQRGFSTAT
jgi:lysophospholipid acyltransferase (LPLAT)-like uncharacterized protein